MGEEGTGTKRRRRWWDDPEHGDPERNDVNA
jgi:hypothetical protein